MRSTRGFVLVAVLLTAGRGAAAQQLRGSVRDASTNAPLAGAVVTVMDSAGTAAARALADAEGRFTIAAPPHAARLHLIRIGYRPHDIAFPARIDTALSIAMDRIPPLLDAVRVSDRELCPGSDERGTAFALWEEARSGLLAAVVARELKPAKARLLSYERDVSPRDGLVRHQQTQIRSGNTTRPFAAVAPASYFAQVGFMSESSDGNRMFSAPDADVLLDPAFAATHCFRLQRADAAHAGQVGLAFVPVPGRDELVDVTGVIWMGDATPQLRSFDFSYTSLEPAAMRMNAGGHLEFRTMPNGIAFISWWNLRLPVMNLAATSAYPEYRPAAVASSRRQDRTNLRLTEIVEAGGVVLDATWPDGAVFRSAPTEITGVVVQRGSGAPVRHAVVTLAGTNDSTTTDGVGAFRLRAVPGTYSLVAADTLLHAFVAERTDDRVVTAVRDRITDVRLELEPAAKAMAEACAGVRMPENLSILAGRVSPTAAAIPRDARVRAIWQADYDLTSRAGIKIGLRQNDSSIDDRGRFIVCGVARQRPIQLELRLGDFVFADTTVVINVEALTLPVDWRLPSVMIPKRKP